MTLDRLSFLRRRPWRDVELPPDATGVPTMLSKNERKLLYVLARDYAAGDAAIVDAGCFLGGSTAALLCGVRDRPQPWSGLPVVSYDLFRVEAYTIPKFFAHTRGVRVGDSFRHEFNANVERFDVAHVVYEGDITQIGWSGESIDVLFLDVLKSWEINDAVLRDFFPSLVPGRSVIVQQDYGWGYLPWIPITMELMRDSVSLIDGMEWGSHAFFVEHEIPRELVRNGVSSIARDDQLAILAQAIAAAPERWVRGMIEISRVAVISDHDGAEAGLQDLDRIAADYADEPFTLECIAYVKEGLETDWTFRATGDRNLFRSGDWRLRLAEARRRVAATLR